MAQLVRTTREQQRLTQTDLAREAGISQPMLALLESGKRRINDAMVQKLWAALFAHRSGAKECSAGNRAIDPA